MSEDSFSELRKATERAMGGSRADRSAFKPRPTHIFDLLEALAAKDREIAALREALKAAEPILAARSGWCGDDNDEVFPVLLKVRAALAPQQPQAKP